MAISRSLIPQQISKGGKMPKVGEKHFKYTKKGREKAKKHAKKTGLEVTNRKYYASGGAVYGEARKRKPTGRLSMDDITNALRAAGSAGSAGWFSPKGFEGLSPIGKPVPRKKKLYTTLQQQSKVQKRKKAKRRAAGTKHMGKTRLGVAGMLKYFRQPLKGK